MNKKILMETNYSFISHKCEFVYFLVETNIMNMIDSHQDQQLESDLNIKDQFRNVLFPGKI